jgi:hypothetical protein
MMPVSPQQASPPQVSRGSVTQEVSGGHHAPRSVQESFNATPLPALAMLEAPWMQEAPFMNPLASKDIETFSYPWLVAYLGIEPPALDVLMNRLGIMPVPYSATQENILEPYRQGYLHAHSHTPQSEPPRHHHRQYTLYDKISVEFLQQALQLTLPQQGDPLSPDEQERIIQNLRSLYHDKQMLEQKQRYQIFLQASSTNLTIHAPHTTTHHDHGSQYYEGLHSMTTSEFYTAPNSPSELSPSDVEALDAQAMSKQDTPPILGAIRDAAPAAIDALQPSITEIVPPASSDFVSGATSSAATTLGFAERHPENTQGYFHTGSLEQLLQHVSFLRETLQTTLLQQVHEAVAPVEKLGLELIRLQEHNRLLEQRLTAMSQELHTLQQEVESFKPFQFGLYKKVPK